MAFSNSESKGKSTEQGHVYVHVIPLFRLGLAGRECLSSQFMHYKSRDAITEKYGEDCLVIYDTDPKQSSDGKL